eukprot:6482987-Amphidinium_carterae.1
MTGYAYLRERLLGDLEGYPWCLTRGDVKSNILAEMDECPADSVCLKVFTLHQMGVALEDICAG